MKLKQTVVALIIAVACLLPVASAVPVYAVQCGGVETSVVECNSYDKATGFMSLLESFLRILTGAVGVAAVGGIVYGGAIYATARGKAEQTKKAVTIITNVGIGLVMYALTWAFLNFLIPGGVFG